MCCLATLLLVGCVAATRPATAPAASRAIHVPPKDKNEVVVLDIKDLANFDYDIKHGGNIPADVMALSGRKFRTHGFMQLLSSADNITDFALTPYLDYDGKLPPQVHQLIVVHCPPGKAVNYTPDEIQVEGILTVAEKKEDGYPVGVFEMQATSVKFFGK